MGAAASTNGSASESDASSVTELRRDVAPSSQPFANKVFGYLLSARAHSTTLPAEFTAAVNRLSDDATLLMKKSLDASHADFTLPADEPLWIELAKGIVSAFPRLDANVRSKLVPGRITEHEFWRRFLWRLRKELRKSHDRERAVAVAAVLKASRVTQAVHAQLVRGQTLAKDDRSPVTVADYAAQAVLLTELARAFPNDRVCAEEEASLLRRDHPDAAELRAVVASLVNGVQAPADQLSTDAVLEAIDRGAYKGGAKGRFWTVDPVDGTKGFVRGEQYAVCLALIEDGEVVLGVLGCPNLPHADGSGARGALFVATVGSGALCVPLPDAAAPIDAAAALALATPISVDALKDASLARFTESVEEGHSSHSDAVTIAGVLGIERPSLRLDSQCKYAVVARGEASVYLRLPTKAEYREKIWDHAAGAVIVKEAGGAVTDARGRPLDFSRGASLALNSGVVATNGILHNRVLDAVRAVLYPVHSYYVTLEGRAPPTEVALASAIADALKLDKDAVRVSIANDEESSDGSTETDSASDEE
jgi:3'(2'), 5'-bisphosphate nucleotidase